MVTDIVSLRHRGISFGVSLCFGRGDGKGVGEPLGVNDDKFDHWLAPDLAGRKGTGCLYLNLLLPLLAVGLITSAGALGLAARAGAVVGPQAGVATLVAYPHFVWHL